LKNHRPLLEFLITVNSPPPDPEFKIAFLNEAEDGVDAVVIECRGLSCGASREDDGSWSLSFTIWVTTVFALGPVVTTRKVPMSTLQEKLLSILGIETRFEGHTIYPSLVGRVPCRPDPNKLLAKMKVLMASVELPSLYTEPNDELVEDADSY